VKRAGLGRQVLRAVRPRRLNVVFRSRAPLALQLRLAHLDGRLIWRSADTFVLVQPPIPAKARMGAKARVIHALDRLWDALVLAVPAFLCLLLALVLAFVFDLRVPALFASLAALLWAAVLMMLGGVVHTLSSGLAFLLDRGTAARQAGESFRGDNWSIALCHVADPRDVEGLLEEAVRLVDRLSARYEYGADKVLVFAPEAASTPQTLDALRKCARVRSFGAGDDSVLLVREPGRTPTAPSFAFNGVPLLLLASAVLLLSIAQGVAEWEREACATACTGGPTSYGAALFWLFRYYVVVGIPGAAPATFRSTSIALMLPFLSAVVLVNVVMVARESMRKARERQDALLAEVSKDTTTSTVLVLVANATERDAVVRAVGRGEVTRLRTHHHTVFDLGVVSRARLLLAQTEQGVDAQGAATLTTDTLIRELTPDFVLLVGICYGLREREQHLGGLVISSRMRALNWRKELPDRTVVRGELVTAGVRVLDRCRAATMDWAGPEPDFGLLLSMSVLVNSAEFRASLLELEPDAVGGETEAAGVHGACAKHKVDWIAIKGISDWGMDKSDGHQTVAARNAADFLLHLLRTGGLDPVD
jgi:nucleoside phosphorylase